MRVFARIVSTVLAVVVVVSPWSDALATRKVKDKPYKSQITETFVNTEGVTVHGLVVNLSSDAEVLTDDDNAAGAFRNISGNGSSTIKLTNPHEPISSGGGEDGQVVVEFRSYSKELKVKSWFWVDASGKRVGQKKKG